MKEAFIERNFSAKSLEVIQKANEIIRAYQAQGFTLTLRQLYYQFVSRDLIANRQSEYKRLGSIINDARLAGLIDWSAIEDRTRNVRGGDGWANDPGDWLKQLAPGYSEALWRTQPYHIEQWIEKDALIGVIEPACNRWRLPYLACRGYVSQSEQYSAGKRFARYRARGRTPVVLYAGDHDPSGMDMTRDHQDRLAMFARMGVEVRRIALNMDQIRAVRSAPEPRRRRRTRARGPYIEEIREDSSWELDALEPTVIDQLIEDQLQELVDHEAWAEAEAEENDNRDRLVRISDRWDEIVDFLGEGDADA